MSKATAAYIDEDTRLRRAAPQASRFTMAALVMTFVLLILGATSVLPGMTGVASTSASAAEPAVLPMPAPTPTPAPSTPAPTPSPTGSATPSPSGSPAPTTPTDPERNEQPEDDPGFLGLFCGDKQSLGGNMNKSNWKQFMRYYPSPDASGRQWTLQEALGSGAKFTGYTGEGGKGNALVYAVGDKRGEGIGKFEDQVEKLSGPRQATNCLFNSLGVYLGDALLKTGAGISSISQMISVVVFDSKLICTDPQNPTGTCFNLVKAIGGTSQSDGGVVGVLTGSVYMPLVVVVAAIAGLYVLWIGFARRQFRQAFGAVLWVVFSFIFGLTILLNPHILAKAPMAINNAVTSCVVGAFNGDSCMGDSTTADLQLDSGESTSDKICVSKASVPLDEQMSLTANSLTCSVWKAFVLEPYAQGQFGRSFEDLDTTNEDVNKAITDAELDPNSFCVNLGTSGSLNDQKDYLELTQSGSQVCNLAAYQMYLGTKAQGAPGSVDKPETPLMDENWYKIALVTSTNDSMWDTWALSFNSGFKKITVGATSVLASIIGGWVIMVISVFALVYYLTAVLIIALAPLFFLIGVHPGRGRRILFGWAETLFSNILKYLISAVFLVVTLALYGAVLSGLDNLGLTLIFLIILTFALLMYRKEIIDMLGRVNMAGERMSNNFSEAVSKRVDRAKQNARATVGGALGGAVASGVSTPMDYFRATQNQLEKDRDLGRGRLRQAAGAAGAVAKTFGQDAKDAASGVNAGAKGGFKRDLRRGTGVVANAAREADRLQTDNRRDAKSIGDTTRQEATRYNEDLQSHESDVRRTEEAIEHREAELIEGSKQYETAVEVENLAKDYEAKVLMEMRGTDPIFAQMQSIANKLDELNRSIASAKARGDVAAVQELTESRDALDARYAGLNGQIDADGYAASQARFNDNMRTMYDEGGFGDDFDDMRKSNRAVIDEFENKLNEYDAAVEEHNDFVDNRNQAKYDLNIADATAKQFTEGVNDLRPGDSMRDSKIDRWHAAAEQDADQKNSRPGEFTEHHERIAVPRRDGGGTDGTDPAGGYAVPRKPKGGGSGGSGAARRPSGAEPGATSGNAHRGSGGSVPGDLSRFDSSSGEKAPSGWGSSDSSGERYDAAAAAAAVVPGSVTKKGDSKGGSGSPRPATPQKPDVSGYAKASQESLKKMQAQVQDRLNDLHDEQSGQRVRLTDMLADINREIRRREDDLRQ